MVYDPGGNRSGRVQGFTEHGFEVEREDTSNVSFEHDPGAGFGEGYMMWRSTNCGETGKLQRMPDTRPNCGYGAGVLYA